MRLLEAGLQLMRENPVGNVFSQIKATQVTRRANLSTGAFYHHWPDQAAFVQDLLDQHLTQDRDHWLSEVSTALAETAESDASLAETVRTVSSAVFEVFKHDPSLTIQLALWTRHHDNSARARLQQRYRTMAADVIPLYQTVLDRHDLTLRPPYTPEMLAVAFSALIEGLLIRWSVDPQAVPDDLPGPHGRPGTQPALSLDADDRPWSSFALILYALIESATTPRT